jgi:hypothetical protein
MPTLDLSELVGYEVMVGGLAGVPSLLVPDELSRFVAAVRTPVATLDAAIPPPASPDAAQLIVHGEWTRIHPFAYGNGRTARAWGNWVALRYRLPAFIRLKPRPTHLLYAGAAAASGAAITGRCPWSPLDAPPATSCWVRALSCRRACRGVSTEPSCGAPPRPAHGASTWLRLLLLPVSDLPLRVVTLAHDLA